MSCKVLIAASLHLLPGEWNELHPGAKCQAENGLFAAAYLNSESTLSMAVGLDFGLVEIGVVTGYSGGTVLPMARVTVPLSDQTDLFLAPAMTGDGDVGAVVGVEVSWP